MTGRRKPLAAVFLEMDGTLIRDIPYNVDARRIEWMPGAAEGIGLLAEAGYALVIVSYQSGVARGFFREAALRLVERKLRGMFADVDAPLAGFYYCPHHPQGTVAEYATECRCRKPLPGLLLRAADELKLDLSRSWLVGDLLDDVEAGNRAGCRTVLIDNGHETRWQWNRDREPNYVAPDLTHAAAIIAEITGKVSRILELVP